MDLDIGLPSHWLRADAFTLSAAIRTEHSVCLPPAPHILPSLQVHGGESALFSAGGGSGAESI